MSLNFNGKRALVTGAGKGIGLDVAKQLAKYGSKVVAVSRTESDLRKLKEEVPSIETLCLDVSDWKKTEEALADIGPIDLLVNNAAKVCVKMITDLTEEDIDSMFDINVKALINVTRIVVNSMLKRQVPGSIVNISSLSSMVGAESRSAYCASKGAVDAFTRAAALEFGPHNIRVNSVNPTITLTDKAKLLWADPKIAAPHLAKIPLKKFGEVREVTDAVLFLLSDKASMIHGVCLPIDGGTLAS